MNCFLCKSYIRAKYCYNRMPLANTILMIRPSAFGHNEETASTNFFQSQIQPGNKKETHQLALKEFDNMAELLRANDINVLVIDDTATPIKPSAIFPNNWLSTSPEGIVSIFPMYAANRRTEKREDILKMLAEKFIVKDVQ